MGNKGAPGAVDLSLGDDLYARCGLSALACGVPPGIAKCQRTHREQPTAPPARARRAWVAGDRRAPCSTVECDAEKHAQWDAVETRLQPGQVRGCPESLSLTLSSAVARPAAQVETDSQPGGVQPTDTSIQGGANVAQQRLSECR